MESVQYKSTLQNQYSINTLIFYIVINPRISSAMMRVLSFYIYIILTTTLSFFRAVICDKEPKSEEDQKVQKKHQSQLQEAGKSYEKRACYARGRAKQEGRSGALSKSC